MIIMKFFNILLQIISVGTLINFLYSKNESLVTKAVSSFQCLLVTILNCLLMFNASFSSIFCCKYCGCCRRREYERWEFAEIANEKIRIIEEDIVIMNILNVEGDA